MSYPQWLPGVASVLLAVIPVGIWLKIIRGEEQEKNLLIKTFLLGTLAVIPPFVLIFLFDAYPQLNLYAIIEKDVSQAALAAILINIVVGVIEELAKNLIVRIIDKRHPEYIQTIGSALKLNICAGLGFSFAENIFYFYNIWINPAFGASVLFTTFIFRSIFTMCAHMVFSGIFGYYFGIGKFSADITEAMHWEGKKMLLERFISKLTGKLTFEIVREGKNIKGLLIAMGMHAAFNVSFDLQYKLPSILIVAAGALYVYYLLHTKSGHLLFSVIKRRNSSMTPADEDVVVELLGMWLNEGKLPQVIEVCDRLLKRDPDNNVVKIFRAKAMDNQKLRQFYNSLKDVFGKETAGVQGGSAASAGAIPMALENEKVVVEVMDMWFKEGNYKQVLNIAQNLLARNPNSQGAKLLLQKAMDKEKLQKMFDSLSRLFKEE